jgi:catechol 2,3-dioxygenase-like lactoylglutathione lyase family enzyme
MSSTDVVDGAAAAVSDTSRVDLHLEVVILPVADVDRAKDFYAGTLEWRLDADIAVSDEVRIIQVTPPGSPASVIFGSGLVAGQPGSVKSMMLVVNDVQAARSELASRGVAISDVVHGPGAGFFRAGEPGPDPDGNSYSSFVWFDDPDGNGWILQEVRERLPGRVDPPNIPAISELLLETSLHHDRFEKAAPPHNWWDWYAAYYAARLRGDAADVADAAADRYMKDELGVAPG